MPSPAREAGERAPARAEHHIAWPPFAGTVALMSDSQGTDSSLMDDDAARFSVTRTGEDDGRVVLAVSGEVDTYTSARLRDALNEAVESGATDVVLDVSEMEFIDSTGLGVLVGALKKLQERDGKLTLRKPRPTALEVLTIVGLTSHFGIEAEWAAASVAGPGPTSAGGGIDRSVQYDSP